MKKKKHIKRYQLKRKYKKQLTKAIERKLYHDIFIITKEDVNHISLYIPELSKEDHLFTSYNPTSIPAYEFMEEGYANCALFLMNCIIMSNDHLVHDTYIFPALYCFRQYIELTIKFTLNNYGEEITDTHNISALFDALRKYIHPNPEVQNISRLLHELSDIDYNGCTFRYNRVLYKDSKNQEFQQAIDVETLKIRLIQIYKFFYGILEEINIAKEINYEQ
ncbi:hypothetical protein [Segatella copri]|uniref:hypothetical protein n=1 Tax=Segatella copri TaxID=165179 RepID=UPI0025DBC8DB|nr:hypothetical protein [Segatella copri]MDV3105416.1 hypothetical protein [Segatella copri]MDV3112273.1 hypothetical protein [Segatella copri]WOF87970.1 hypothetical protein RJT05_01065 [Segatella copri]WOF94077.1 hypothetical protein RJT10_01025 [Segatella copri]